MARPLIDPRMFSRLGSFYPSTVTIQENTPTQGTMGEEQDVWTNKVGYVDLSCHLAPSGGREVKRPDQTYVVSTHIIAIAGHYPGIEEVDQAIIDGQGYDILLVENDSLGDSTRLVTEIVV